MLKVIKPTAFSSLLDVVGPFKIQIATVMKLKVPPNYDHVKYPSGRRRLNVLEKAKLIDQSLGFIKMPKMLHWMRGPEHVHNRIVYGEYAIQATSGGRLSFRQTESIRMTILRKMDEKQMFAQWRVPSPWQAVSKKGIGIRMGSGKGKVNAHVIPIKPGRIIVEIGGECEFEECRDFLTTITSYLPFESRLVSRQMLETEAKEEEQLEKLNMNPITFKKAAKANLLGIDRWLSPYDYRWNGKYR